MSADDRWVPDGEAYRLNTVAISLPGQPVRMLIDGVAPTADPRLLAREYLAALSMARPCDWLVQVIADTDLTDLVPAGTSPSQPAEKS